MGFPPTIRKQAEDEDAKQRPRTVDEQFTRSPLVQNKDEFFFNTVGEANLQQQPLQYYGSPSTGGLATIKDYSRKMRGCMDKEAALRVVRDCIDGSCNAASRKRKRGISRLDCRFVLFCCECHRILRGGYKLGDYIQCNLCGSHNLDVLRETTKR